MSLTDDESVSPRQVRALLSPSYVSGIVAVLVGLIVIAAPPLLWHFGTTAQQGFLGLNILFKQSSETASARALSTSFLTNPTVGNIVFFAFWGVVGLGVYLIAESIAREIGSVISLMKELGYMHVARDRIKKDLLVRAVTRIVAIVLWWFLLRLLIYKLIPYGSAAAAHASKASSFALSEWLWSIAFGAACVLTVHCMAILLRLMVLRPRLFGGNTEFL